MVNVGHVHMVSREAYMWSRAIIVAVALPALCAACAGLQRDRLIEQRTGAYVYARTPDEVLSAARALLSEAGFQVEETSGGVLRTRWRASYDAEGVAQTHIRYAAAVYPVGRRHCRVQIVRLTRSTMGVEEHHPSLGGAGMARTGAGNTGATVVQGKGSRALPFGSPNLQRDLRMEWKLIQRVDPDRAAQIERSVSAEVARR